MKHKVINRVKEMRELRNMSQDDVGSRINKARGQISRIESGKIKLGEDWLNLLSYALDCSPAELIAYVDVNQVPIIGDVPGGDLQEAIQLEPERYIDFSSKRKNLKGFRVRGNSMSRIAPHGVYVVADFDDCDPATLSGQPVLFCIEQQGVHECGFKIYKRNPDRFEPFSIEPGYDTIFPNDRPWKIYARVIGVVGFIGDESEFTAIEHQGEVV
jgi:transcriptional regulator with XRE-family HTH domain